MVLHLPEGIDVQSDDDFEHFSTDPGDTLSSLDAFSSRIYLPFRLGAGLAFARPHFILAADAIYADWTQIDYEGSLRTDDGFEAYRETVSLRVEETFSRSNPVRLRPLRVRAASHQVLCDDADWSAIEDHRDSRCPIRDLAIRPTAQYITFGAGSCWRNPSH
jgi:hypothetical protein